MNTKREPYTVTKKCTVCKQGKIKTAEGKPVDCPYCKGTGKRIFTEVHPSHKMTPKRTEIIAPCGTPRFYSVRNCEVCGREEWQHAAGHFFHGLQYECDGEMDGDSDT